MKKYGSETFSLFLNSFKESTNLTPFNSTHHQRRSRRRSLSSQRRSKRKAEGGVLVLRLLEAKRVRSNNEDEEAPKYELIAIHGRREFHTHSKSWKHALDEEDKAFWTSPDFEQLNGRNSFIFKYVVGIHSSPLRLIYVNE